MEEEDTKQCPNCKREIPAINFTTHSVHCARNLRNCPVCKEPVPLAQLQEHHDALHKEVPCKKCGESVCGTDLEDHIRDSCAQTIKPCRYCELELPRHALPGHETYCGARSEQCPECREYVMLKYRQLHLDSNHGFLRLDDDPAPKEAKPRPKPPNPITNGFAAPSTSRPQNQNQLSRAFEANPITRSDQKSDSSNKPKTEIRYYGVPSSSVDNSVANSMYNRVASNKIDNRMATNSVDNMMASNIVDNRVASDNVDNGVASNYIDNRMATNSVDNRMASNIVDNRMASNNGVNRVSSNYSSGSRNVAIDNRVMSSMDNRVASNIMDNRMATSSVNNRISSNIVDNRIFSNITDNRMASNIVDSGVARNIVDNRMATSSVDNRMATSTVDNRVAGNNMDNRMASNLMDNRVAERNGRVTAKRTNDQPQINTSVEPREKVHKDLPSRGAVKKRPAPQPPAPDPRRDLPYYSAEKRAQEEERKRQEQTAYNLSVGLPPVLSSAAKLEKLRKMDALHNRETEDDYRHRLQGRVWQPLEPDGHRLGSDLSHLQPMTAQQFMDRFQELQLGAERRRTTGEARSPTRTATGAASADRFSEIKSSLRELRRGLNEVTAPYNSTANAVHNTQIDSNRLCPPTPPPGSDDDGELRLPCEFCGEAVLAQDLVLHQTGCRPDLTQYKPRKSHRPRPRSPRPRPRPRPPTADTEEPVIPCEFCTESLPVYLISEHQERCRRESNVLYPD